MMGMILLIAITSGIGTLLCFFILLHELIKDVENW